MRWLSSRGGKLGFFGAFLSLMASISWARESDDTVWRIAAIAVTAAVVLHIVRWSVIGVFDTDEGIVIKRSWRRRLAIPATAHPVADFRKHRAGHQLIIRADGYPPTPTDFVFARPAIEPQMKVPSNLEHAHPHES